MLEIVVVEVDTLGVVISVEPVVVDCVLAEVPVVPLVVDNVVPERMIDTCIFAYRMRIEMIFK